MKKIIIITLAIVVLQLVIVSVGYAAPPASCQYYYNQYGYLIKVCPNYSSYNNYYAYPRSGTITLIQTTVIIILIRAITIITLIPIITLLPLMVIEGIIGTLIPKLASWQEMVIVICSAAVIRRGQALRAKNGFSLGMEEKNDTGF